MITNRIVEKDFTVFCKEEMIAFEELTDVSDMLNDFFESKTKKVDKEETKGLTKDEYTFILHQRIKDHYLSAYLLLSNGYLVDALTLLRSALEDFFVVTNFHINDEYFKEWIKNKNSFNIKPGELRGKLEKNTIFSNEDTDLFAKVYKSLSNVSHPKKQSIEKMFEYHPKKTDSKIRLKENVSLLIAAMCVNEGLLCKFFKEIHTDEVDRERIKGIELLYAGIFIDLFKIEVKNFDFGVEIEDEKRTY